MSTSIVSRFSSLGSSRALPTCPPCPKGLASGSEPISQVADLSAILQSEVFIARVGAIEKSTMYSVSGNAPLPSSPASSAHPFEASEVEQEEGMGHLYLQDLLQTPQDTADFVLFCHPSRSLLRSSLALVHLALKGAPRAS